MEKLRLVAEEMRELVLAFDEQETFIADFRSEEVRIVDRAVESVESVEESLRQNLESLVDAASPTTELDHLRRVEEALSRRRREAEEERRGLDEQWKAAKEKEEDLTSRLNELRDARDEERRRFVATMAASAAEAARIEEEMKETRNQSTIVISTRLTSAPKRDAALNAEELQEIGAMMGRSYDLMGFLCTSAEEARLMEA